MKTTLRTLSLVLVGAFALLYAGCGGGGGGGGGAPSDPNPIIASADAIQYAAGSINFTANVSNGDVVYYEYGIGAFTNATPTRGGPTFLYQVTGLTEGATYQYRAIATNSHGTTTGETQTVVVNTATAPVATTGSITEGGVIAVAYVNPRGLDTTYRFGYFFQLKSNPSNYTPNYYTSWGSLPVTNTYYDVYTVTAGLVITYPIGETGTYYLYYWVEAQNSLGLVYGLAAQY
jgi:hypothetical protein